MKKKIISLCLLVLCSLPNASFANQTDSSVGVTENPSYLIDESINNKASYNNEISYKPYGFDYPSAVYNIGRRGAYSFSGQTGQNPLYTDYLFTGKTTYSVYASSLHSSYGLYIIAYQKRFGPDKKLGYVDAISPVSFAFNTDSASDKVYLKFIAPCHFSGQIS